MPRVSPAKATPDPARATSSEARAEAIASASGSSASSVSPVSPPPRASSNPFLPSANSIGSRFRSTSGMNRSGLPPLLAALAERAERAPFASPGPATPSAAAAFVALPLPLAPLDASHSFLSSASLFLLAASPFTRTPLLVPPPPPPSTGADAVFSGGGSSRGMPALAAMREARWANLSSRDSLSTCWMMLYATRRVAADPVMIHLSSATDRFWSRPSMYCAFFAASKLWMRSSPPSRSPASDVAEASVSDDGGALHSSPNRPRPLRRHAPDPRKGEHPCGDDQAPPTPTPTRPTTSYRGAARRIAARRR
mmetsp:Transcript_17053/g.49221  ORF Transcript_17053/g.49221 Transcript_17053/m.49221 type:complete len:310 (+) Transcript_17053:1467-2396(+)